MYEKKKSRVQAKKETLFLFSLMPRKMGERKVAVSKATPKEIKSLREREREKRERELEEKRERR